MGRGEYGYALAGPSEPPGHTSEGEQDAHEESIQQRLTNIALDQPVVVDHSRGGAHLDKAV